MMKMTETAEVVTEVPAVIIMMMKTMMKEATIEVEQEAIINQVVVHAGDLVQ
jgi:hypothetical protein